MARHPNKAVPGALVPCGKGWPKGVSKPQPPAIPNNQQRWYRAMEGACEVVGITPDDVPALRGHQSRVFHTLWTQAMIFLAKQEGAWNDVWDTRTRRSEMPILGREPVPIPQYDDDEDEE